MLIIMTQQVEAASQKRDESKARMSAKDRPKANAQWKAHPDKGWVRVDEDHDSRNGKKETADQSNGNRQNSGSKKK